MDSTGRILAIVVLYKRPFEESPGLSSLRGLIAQGGAATAAIDLMVCDNSPYEQTPPGDFTGRFFRDTTNPGLARWFNMGLKIARESGCNWLLLLDQDTTVPPEYFAEVLAG